MTPTTLIENALATLLATDTGTLDAVARVRVHLAKAPFVPSRSRVLADFTEADFDGYGSIQMGAGSPFVNIDPGSGNYMITLKEPLGGWEWAVSGVTNLPQTIYGIYLTDNASADLYGCELFPNPVILTAAGMLVDLGWARFNNVGGGIF